MRACAQEVEEVPNWTEKVNNRGESMKSQGQRGKKRVATSRAPRKCNENPASAETLPAIAVPPFGCIVESLWCITTRGSAAAVGSASGEGSEDGGDFDLDFRPSATSLAAGTAALKKGRATKAREGWWPGMVIKCEPEVNSAMRAHIRYTVTADGHGVVPGAGLEYFTGATSIVDLIAARRAPDLKMSCFILTLHVT